MNKQWATQAILLACCLCTHGMAMALEPAGSLDPTFGPAQNGKVVTNLDPNVVVSVEGIGDLDQNFRVLPGKNGTLYQVGSARMVSDEIQYQFVLAAFDYNGYPISSFGGGKGSLTYLHPEFESMTALGGAVQPDGKIIVIGNGIGPDFYSEGIVCRFVSNGTIDVDFADSGCRKIPLDGSNIRDVIVQADGSIIVTGNYPFFDFAEVRSHSFIAQLDNNGEFRSSFDDDGIALVHPPLDGNLDLKSLAIVADGSIAVAGSLGFNFGGNEFQDNMDFLVLKIDQFGQPDDSFGNKGVVTHAFDSNIFDKKDRAVAIQALPDGSLLIAGSTTDNGGSNAIGMLKLSSTGKGIYPFPQKYSICNQTLNCDLTLSHMKSAPSGKIYLTGRILRNTAAGVKSGYDFFVWRLTPDGWYDGLYAIESGVIGGMAKVSFDLGLYSDGAVDDVASSLVLQGERVIVGGVCEHGTDSPNGSPTKYCMARLDHGIDEAFTVTINAGQHGTAPMQPMSIVHSDQAVFKVVPDPGYKVLATGCGGTIDGPNYYTAPIVADCEVDIAFTPNTPLGLPVFSDDFE